MHALRRHQRCRTLRSSWGPRRWSPAGAARRTRSRPPPPERYTHTYTGEQAAEGCGWSRAGAHLVRSANEVQVMSAQELSHHVLSEGERHPCTTHRGQGWMLREDRSGQVSTSVVLAPAHDVLVRVRPQQVAQQTRVGYVYTHTHTYIPISIQTHTHTYTMRLIFNECLMGGPGTRIIVIAITQP